MTPVLTSGHLGPASSLRRDGWGGGGGGGWRGDGGGGGGLPSLSPPPGMEPCAGAGPTREPGCFCRTLPVLGKGWQVALFPSFLPNIPFKLNPGHKPDSVLPFFPGIFSRRLSKIWLSRSRWLCLRSSGVHAGWGSCPLSSGFLAPSLISAAAPSRSGSSRLGISLAACSWLARTSSIKGRASSSCPRSFRGGFGRSDFQDDLPEGSGNFD